jgi:hypothetical protein
MISLDKEGDVCIACGNNVAFGVDSRRYLFAQEVDKMQAGIRLPWQLIRSLRQSTRK